MPIIKFLGESHNCRTEFELSCDKYLYKLSKTISSQTLP